MKIVTITDNLKATDFDLYERVVDGFEAIVIGPGESAFKEDSIIYCHDISYLIQSLSTGVPVVCFGEKWTKVNPPITNKVNGYFTNSLDEIRYILRRLLVLPIDKREILGYNGKVLAEQLLKEHNNGR